MLCIVGMSSNGAMFHHVHGWEILINKLNIENSTGIIKLFRNRESNFLWLLSVYRSILSFRQNKCIFFLNGEFNIVLLPLIFFARCHGVKVILTWHDVVPHPGQIRNYVLWFFSFINAFFSNHVVVHNFNYSKLSIPFLKQFVYMPLPPLVLNFNDNGPIVKNDSIIFFGRIEYYKGLERVLKLYEGDLFSLNKNFIVVGTGSDNYINILNLKNNLNVSYLGFKSDFDLIGLIKSSSAIVMPYLHCSQSLNPYWASILKVALIVSVEVSKSLPFANLKGYYIFSNNFELLHLLRSTTVLEPFEYNFSHDNNLNFLKALLHDVN